MLLFLAAFSVSDIFRCFVHKHVSLVISLEREIFCGRILLNGLKDSFSPKFSLTNVWHSVDR